MSLKNYNQAIISGNTFACKEKIKELGGQWNSSDKTWIINIRSHPRNTMKARGGLEMEIRGLAAKGCVVRFE